MLQDRADRVRAEALAELRELLGIDLRGLARDPVPAPGSRDLVGRMRRRGWLLWVQKQGLPYTVHLVSSDELRQPLRLNDWLIAAGRKGEAITDWRVGRRALRLMHAYVEGDNGESHEELGE